MKKKIQNGEMKAKINSEKKRKAGEKRKKKDKGRKGDRLKNETIKRKA